MNILSSSSSSTISNEELLRLRFKLEDNLKEFFSILSASKIREIELATAKLLDIIVNTNDEVQKISLMFKVSILQSYHILRQSGDRKYNSLARFWSYSPPLTDVIVKYSIVPKGLKIDVLPNDLISIEIVKKYS